MLMVFFGVIVLVFGILGLVNTSNDGPGAGILPFFITLFGAAITILAFIQLYI